MSFWWIYFIFTTLFTLGYLLEDENYEFSIVIAILESIFFGWFLCPLILYIFIKKML